MAYTRLLFSKIRKNYHRTHCGDFKKKKIYIGKTISLTDLQTRSQESIMQEIQDYYKDITPKYPEQWNPKIY